MEPPSALSAADLDQIAAHLDAAQAILKRLRQHAPQPDASRPERNPLWFRPTGHLSDAGIAALYELFERGISDEKAALTLGIAVRSTTARRAAWKRLRQPA